MRQAKKRGVRVTAEATPHHLTMTDECVDLKDSATKVNPPLRGKADVEALLAGLKDGTIDAIATDHSPHAEEEKDVEYALAPSGFPGLETAVGVLLTDLCHEGKVELPLLISKMTAEPAKILDMPQYDVRSQSPNLRTLLFLCILLGLFFPAGILYVYILFNDTVDDAQEYEKMLRAPVLGQLVENSRHAHIAIHEGESTVSAELFRLIRTNLRFMLPAEKKSPVILVTSCVNGEGKSYVSSNTALSLAILGKKVALVGLDIRKPMLAVYFNLSQKGHLTDYLSEPDVEIDDIIVPSGEHKNLDIIPCGTIPPNPAELLQTERLDALFAELRKRYDYIIVDTAPVALVSDTYLLDRIADMTIFVSRYKYTQTEMIEYINQVVEQKRMHNVAGVLNGVKGMRAGYGYGAQQS